MTDDERPGINSSGTRRKSRNTVVVVANDPIPSVSKKLVTNPMRSSSAVGAVGCPPRAASRLVAIVQRTTSSRPAVASAPRRIRTSVNGGTRASLGAARQDGYITSREELHERS